MPDGRLTLNPPGHYVVGARMETRIQTEVAMRSFFALLGLLAAALLLSAGSCDDGGSCDCAPVPPTPPPLVVTSVSPPLFAAYQATPFTVTGSGFMRGVLPKPGSGGPAALSIVGVTFHAPAPVPAPRPWAAVRHATATAPAPAFVSPC